MSRHLGLKAPNHFHLVITRQRNVSPAVLEKIVRLLKLSPRERQYIRLLFQLNQSTNPKVRADLEEQIKSLQTLYEQDQGQDTNTHNRNLPIVGHTLAWYIKIASIRLEGLSKTDIIEYVKKTALFPASAEEIDMALSLLIDAEQLRFEDGKACFDDSEIKTKWDFSSEQIKSHHRANLQLALQTIPWPIDKRVLTSVSVAVDDALYQEIISEMRALCQSILDRSKQKIMTSSDAKKIATLQLSLFPFMEF
jgi:uncharacterized protein (TIGR02147 family)